MRSISANDHSRACNCGFEMTLLSANSALAPNDISRWEGTMIDRFASVLLAVLLVSSPASAKDKITYAYLIDPVLDGFTHAIRTGKIKSDLIDVELTALSVPALIQA